jgi:hypothetical protein
MKVLRPMRNEEKVELLNLQSSPVIFRVVEARVLGVIHYTKEFCLLQVAYCGLCKKSGVTKLANLKISNWGSQLPYPSIAPPSLCCRGKVGGPPGVVVGVLFEGIPLFVKG